MARALIGVLLLFPLGARAQEIPRLWLEDGAGERVRVEVATHRGYPAFPLVTLDVLGWDTTREGKGGSALPGDGDEVRFTGGSPFFYWGEDLLQMVEPPYLFQERIYVSVQLLSDFLPDRLRRSYDFDPDRGTLTVLDESFRLNNRATGGAEAAPPPERLRAPAASPQTSAPAPPQKRVVVIDAGHGGRDSGAVGPGGTPEKVVALAVALALARELEKDADVEVYLTRDRDRFIPLWERGEKATNWKGERPGVFISLHMNSLSDRRVRGFETYFLSEARTEHERRVAAIENAALQFEGDGGGARANEDLGFILNELRNLDQQHWSSLLAELVQGELAQMHEGPDRGVKQGPFAVITNAMMPSVLVELGFISNRNEERTISEAGFQTLAARSVARAIRSFFRRYPPG